MLAINARQYLSVITTTGADIHVSVTYRDSGLGRGHTRTDCTAITAAVATPGTSVLAGPDTNAASKEVVGVHIRNIDTSSQTVTVCLVSTDDAGTQTVFQLYKETLAAGQELIFEEGAGWTFAQHSTIGVWYNYITAADVTNQTANVLGNITGLTHTVVSGEVYEFKAVVPFTTGAGTTGLRVTVNGPAMTFVNYSSRYPVSAVLDTMNNLSALQEPAAANADTVNGVATVEGTIKPSANGTFAVQFASENNAAVITALAGSTLRIRRVL